MNAEPIKPRGYRPPIILTAAQHAHLQASEQAHNERFDKVWAAGLGKEWKHHYFEYGKRLCDGTGTMPWAREERGRKSKVTRCPECQKMLDKQKRQERKAKEQ